MYRFVTSTEVTKLVIHQGVTFLVYDREGLHPDLYIHRGTSKKTKFVVSIVLGESHKQTNSAHART